MRRWSRARVQAAGLTTRARYPRWPCGRHRAIPRERRSFTRDVAGIAVFHVAAGGGPLKVAIKFDPVGWIEINALHLSPQAFAFGEAGHDLEGIAEDHAVGPVLIVLVELGFVHAFGDAVEIGEEIGLEAGFLGFGFFGLAEEIVDQDFGMDFFLDVEGRRLNDEVGPILLIFAAPDELRIEIAVALHFFFFEARRGAFVGDGDGSGFFLFQDGLEFGGGNVLPLVVVVLEGFDGFGGFGCRARHGVS